MTAITAYDRRTIMTEAWDRTRALIALNPGVSRAAAHAMYLSEEWTNEKSRLANARRAERLAALTIDQIEAQVARAHHYGELPDDFRLTELYPALEAKKAEGENAAKRDLIQSANTCTVTFTKKDGSRRVMRVEARKVAEHVKGDKATRSARIASHTRAFRHPNLFPVWDTEAKAIKSVNLTTVTRIETANQTHNF